MNEKVYSQTTQKTYYSHLSVRIIDQKQQTLYLKHGLELLDIYASKDFKTGKDITVMVFDRKESQPYYEKWLSHELE